MVNVPCFFGPAQLDLTMQTASVSGPGTGSFPSPLGENNTLGVRHLTLELRGELDR